MKPIKSHDASRAVAPSKALQVAAADFRYLLDRHYPRKAVLDMIGNRYELTADQRELLHRGVFSKADSISRRRKRIMISRISGKPLAIDGYNILITVEAGLSGRPLVLADDGFIRDISRVSGAFKTTEITESALRSILEVLKAAKPCRILFLFDAPISRSGELAREVRCRLAAEGLAGDALAVPVPEKILDGFPGVVATSDTAVIDRSPKVVDLAGYTLKKRPQTKFIRWKRRNHPSGPQNPDDASAFMP
jgi:hypothetical protein